MLQVFPDSSLSQCLLRHSQAIELLQSRGFQPLPPPIYSCRSYFLEEFMKVGLQAKGFFYSGKVLYAMIAESNKIYFRTIQEQIENENVKLPKR